MKGKNTLVENRSIEGKVEAVHSPVAGLMLLKLDLFVSNTPTAIRAVKLTTKTIPIVMVITGDPIALGLVASLARPG